MISILFVDDDPISLIELEQGLIHMRGIWEMRFVSSAQEALDVLGKAPVDVVVSEMRIPKTGPQLLGMVRDRYPGVARFILAGTLKQEDAVKMMPVAHQFLKKPCDTALLQRAVEHICSLQSRKNHPGVAKVLTVIKCLPALPQLYWDLVRAIDNPNSGTADVAAIIERDVAMTARFLQIANSSLFGARPVSSIKDAIERIGMAPVKSVVLSLQFFRGMSEACAPKGFSLEQLQAESWETARLASEMIRDHEMRKAAFSGGVLHDVGRLILARTMPDDYGRVCTEAIAAGRKIHEVEISEFGCDHAEIGAQMLSMWGLPQSLVEVVACHHRPSTSLEKRFGPVGAVHVASAIIAERMVDDARRGDVELDADYLEDVGMTDMVAGWRKGEPIMAV